MNFKMIIKRFVKSIVAPGKLETLVYLLLLIETSLAVPRDYKAVSISKDSSDIGINNCSNRPSSAAKILTQVILTGNLGAPELVFNIEYTPDQTMTVNTMIVDDNKKRNDKNDDNVKRATVKPLIFYNDKKMRILNATTTREAETNQIPTISISRSESPEERNSTGVVESTTPMTTSFSDEIKATSSEPGISVERSTNADATSERSTSNIERTTKREINDTSLYTDVPKLWTSDNNILKDKNVKKFTMGGKKTTWIVTTPSTTVKGDIRNLENLGINETKTDEINNSTATSDENVDVTSEKIPTIKQECKIPAISDIDIWKIAKAIKILYGDPNSNNMTVDKVERSSMVTEKVTMKPVTSVWYKLIPKTVTAESKKKKKTGLAKISYR